MPPMNDLFHGMLNHFDNLKSLLDDDIDCSFLNWDINHNTDTCTVTYVVINLLLAIITPAACVTLLDLLFQRFIRLHANLKTGHNALDA